MLVHDRLEEIVWPQSYGPRKFKYPSASYLRRIVSVCCNSPAWATNSFVRHLHAVAKDLTGRLGHTRIEPENEAWGYVLSTYERHGHYHNRTLQALNPPDFDHEEDRLVVFNTAVKIVVDNRITELYEEMFPGVRIIEQPTTYYQSDNIQASVHTLACDNNDSFALEMLLVASGSKADVLTLISMAVDKNSLAILKVVLDHIMIDVPDQALDWSKYRRAIFTHDSRAYYVKEAIKKGYIKVAEVLLDFHIWYPCCKQMCNKTDDDNLCRYHRKDICSTAIYHGSIIFAKRMMRGSHGTYYHDAISASRDIAIGLKNVQMLELVEDARALSTCTKSEVAEN